MVLPSNPIEPVLLPDGAAEAVVHPQRALKVVDLYKAVIGPLQHAYYLKQFARQEVGTGLRLGWHWPAFLAGLNWLIFRKMWVWAARYVGLLVLAGVVTWLAGGVFGFSRMDTLMLGAALWVAVSVLAGLLANALYYRHCMALIHQVLISGADREAAADVLAEEASSNRRWGGQALVNVALMLFLPALAVFAPWNGRDAWEWLTEADTQVSIPEPTQPIQPIQPIQQVKADVADTERRMLQPGNGPSPQATTLAVPEVVAQTVDTAQASAPALPLVPSGPVVQPVLAEPLPPLPATLALAVSEAQASALAGLVLPRETPPVQVAEPVAAAAPASLPQKVAPTAQAPEPPVPAPPVLSVSEAQASVQAGLVLPGDVPPAPATKPVAAAPPASVSVRPAPLVLAGKKPAASGLPTFVVQVGIFAQPANVASAMAQLKAKGLPAYSDPITMAGQARTRVRVGPYRSREEAGLAAQAIASEGLPAVVVPLPVPNGSVSGR